jgi:hypothetical protein
MAHFPPVHFADQQGPLPVSPDVFLPGNRAIVTFYMIGGFAAALTLHLEFADKHPIPMEWKIGVIVASVLLVVFNIWLYRKASREPDPEFPTGAFERYLPPVTATICHALGFIAGLIFSAQ